MADSAPKVADIERQESLQAVDLKAQKLADLITKAKHFIAFTGAGVSTSAGIPDFRGPEGAWTLRAQGRQRTSKATSTLQAIPTPTHMALVALQDRGMLKYLISQNCDGLHRRSGILPERISELHGNSNREYCNDCGKEYIRDFRAVARYEKTVHDHRTGRKCVICGGDLLDSIVNFSEALPAEPQRRARANARKADLCLVLGSSLTVTPACTIPQSVGARKGTKYAICNLQKTDQDGITDLRIWSKTDDLMIRVMEKLDIPIQPFILRRHLVIETESNSDRPRFKVFGVDVDGSPFSFLQSVKLVSERRPVSIEPFLINYRGDVTAGMQFKFELQFMGHYGEPNLEITHDLDCKHALHLLEYNPNTGVWTTSRQDSGVANEAAHDNVSKDGDSIMEDETLPDLARRTPNVPDFEV